ncbi:MAG TPA: baseplate J/gp47 family protein [Candidatus Limnocylindria bacterium]|nr:baseplate J/gp47 family protein [Candidatus Limnocylindria bacterium]
MATEPQIIYLEPDDEITSVIRRLRETDAARVVLVAPGRTKATSSAVALRLLAGVAADEGRELALVADPLARSLAAEAGIPAHASVAEATAGSAPAVEATPARRAAIHVVRPEVPAAAVTPPRSAPGDETRAVPVVRTRPGAARRPPPPPQRRRAEVRRRPAVRLVGVAVLIAALLAAGGIAAAVLPAATIRITPEAKPVGPVSYSVTPAGQQHLTGTLPLTMSAKATGDHVERTQARGTVLFQSGNPGRCRVPQGTRVAAGKIVFETVETVVVPEGKFTGQGIKPGSKSVGIVAVEAGPAGNVPAGAIDTIQDDGLSFCLRGFPNTTHRIVDNPEATSGGTETHTPEIKQEDVTALSKALTDALAEQLAAELAKHDDLLMIAPAEPEKATVEVPEDLVGTRDQATFELSGTLAYDRPGVPRAEVETAARERLLADAAAIPDGTTLDPESIKVAMGAAMLDDDSIQVAVSVTAAAIPKLDTASIRDRLSGLTPAEAQAMLADVGDVTVDLWPGWVSRIPGMDWRVSIEVASEPSAGPGPSGSP